MPAILCFSFSYLLLQAFALGGEGKKLLARLALVLPLPLFRRKLAPCSRWRQLLFLFLRCVVLLTGLGTILAYGKRETPAFFASALGASFAKMFYVERRGKALPSSLPRWAFSPKVRATPSVERSGAR